MAPTSSLTSAILLTLCGGVSSFASVPGTPCADLMSVADGLDGSDDGTVVNLDEMLASAQILRDAGCQSHVASDATISERFAEAEGGDEDSALSEGEMIALMGNIRDEDEEALIACVTTSMQPCTGAARRKLDTDYVHSNVGSLAATTSASLADLLG